MSLKKLNPKYFGNMVFGIEDSLVSTVGVLFGISTVLPNKSTILLTGLIVIGVAALSMAAGVFISSESTQELNKKRKHSDKPLIGALIMFFSYFVAGFIPLAPYLLFDVNVGKYVSIGVSLLALFLLGYMPAKKLKSGIRTALIAGFAILFGYLLGSFAKGLPN